MKPTGIERTTQAGHFLPENETPPVSPAPRHISWAQPLVQHAPRGHLQTALMPPKIREDAAVQAVVPSCPSELGAALTILMHRPGIETSFGVLHALSALYEKPFDVQQIALEHQGYVALLKHHGAHVYLLRDALKAGTTFDSAAMQRLRDLAMRCITIDAGELPPEERAAQTNFGCSAL